MTRAELLAAVVHERYNCGDWFTVKTSREAINDDSDLACSRRRRALLEDFDRAEREGAA